VGGPEDQILERRDRQGNDIGDTVCNDLQDFDLMEDGTLMMRDGCVKQQETGFSSSIWNMFYITLGGRNAYGYQNAGGFDVYELAPLAYDPWEFEPAIATPENEVVNPDVEVSIEPSYTYPPATPAYGASNPENGYAPEFDLLLVADAANKISAMDNDVEVDTVTSMRGFTPSNQTLYNPTYTNSAPFLVEFDSTVVAFEAGDVALVPYAVFSIVVFGGSDTVAPTLVVDPSGDACGSGVQTTHWVNSMSGVTETADWLTTSDQAAPFWVSYDSVLKKNAWSYNIRLDCDKRHNGPIPTGALYYRARIKVTASYAGEASAIFEPSCLYSSP
jgi:hypothetical protein